MPDKWLNSTEGSRAKREIEQALATRRASEEVVGGPEGFAIEEAEAGVLTGAGQPMGERAGATVRS